MLFTFLSWILIGFSAWLWGAVVRKAMNRLTGSTYNSLLCDLMLGLCVLTVFAEFFSLFFLVGSVALATVISVDILIVLLNRKFFAGYIWKIFGSVLSWKLS